MDLPRRFPKTNPQGSVSLSTTKKQNHNKPEATTAIAPSCPTMCCFSRCSKGNLRRSSTAFFFWISSNFKITIHKFVDFTSYWPTFDIKNRRNIIKQMEADINENSVFEKQLITKTFAELLIVNFSYQFYHQ